MSLIERSFREKIVLVGVTIPPETVEDTEASLDELGLLVDTAGADEVGRLTQRARRPTRPPTSARARPRSCASSPSPPTATRSCSTTSSRPAQQFNLEKLLGRTAIDRTAVILDIFAQNAHSQEGKAQVELALLRYRLPRLRGRGKALSQQAGGMSAAGGARIGTRGPGETQLEVDRRRLVRRIHKLEAELRDIAQHRATQRKAQRSGAAQPGRRSSATPTPASRPCSTGSPTPACWSRTGCSPRSTPPPGAWSCPAARPC